MVELDRYKMSAANIIYSARRLGSFTFALFSLIAFNFQRVSHETSISHRLEEPSDNRTKGQFYLFQRFASTIVKLNVKKVLLVLIFRVSQNLVALCVTHDSRLCDVWLII